MAIHFIKPEAKRDWFKTSKHIAYFAFAASKLNVPGMAKEAENAAGCLKDMNLDQRAWCWLSITTQTALYGLSQQLNTKFDLSEHEPKDKIRTFSAKYLEDAAEHVLTPTCFWNPADQPVLADLVANLTEFAKLFALGAGHDDLTAEFRREAKKATFRIAQLDQAFYAPLERAMDSLYGEGERRESAWRDHLRWINYLYEGKPTFSPDETETTSLSAVYQRLRCFWHEDVRDEEAEDSNAKKRIVRIGDLHGETMKWLKDDNSPLVRVITGGPGSGKSSFARAFAMEADEQTDFRIAFAELQHMSLGDRLEDRLKADFSSLLGQSEGGGKRGLPGGPLALQQDAGEPLLLIFDGLDELTVDQATGRDVATQFLQQVDRMTQKYRMPVVKALVLGRSIACQEGVERSDLTLADMYHVAPLRPMVSRQDIGLGSDATSLHSETHDPDDLAEIDQRPEYYRRWAKARSQQEEMPSVVTSDDVQGLNAEPLLLHLLLLSERTEKEILDNPNLVYRDIFEKIHLRNQRIPGRLKMPMEDFDLLMECIALATWRGAGRTATEADYLAVRADHARAREEALAPEPAANLRNVAVQFHARKGQVGGEGFEFIHKSFSEYLIARALLRLAQTLCSSWKTDLSEEETLLRWTRVIGTAELTRDILRFLRNEARIWENAERRGALISTASALFSRVQITGMPAHKAAPEKDFRTIETTQRCAETTLLAVLNALVNADEGLDTLLISWPSVETAKAVGPKQLTLAPRHLIQRLSIVDAPVCGELFDKLDLSESSLDSLLLSNWSLIGADLRRASLINTTLGGAALQGADLREANLFNADLSGAEMRGADLRNASIRAAELEDTVLVGANLFGVDFSYSNLTKAELEGANLENAVFKGADLEAAFIGEADFSKAKELTQIQINLTNGSKSTTKLPPHLTAPDHWDDL